MKHIRRGTYSRDKMPRALRSFSPTESLESLSEVDLLALKEAGKDLILLDVDNTLLPWKSIDIPAETTEWVEEAKAEGFDICILSNTRNPARLSKICEKLGVTSIRDRFKPSRKMYHMALGKFSRTPNQAIMIGDQLFTDILGANRSGIDSVWVRPMSKREFLGTSVLSRNLERIVGKFLYQYFQPHEEIVEKQPGVFTKSLIGSLFKFVSAGVISTIIDLGLHYVLMKKATVGDASLREVVGTWAIQNFHPNWPVVEPYISDAAFAPLKVGPVCIAIMNSYFLNRALTTFNTQKDKASVREGSKFFIVAGLAAMVNVGFASLGHHLFEGNQLGKFIVGSLMGMTFGFLVNFNGQRLITFADRKRKNESV